MQHLGTKRIETERLLLRPFTLDDAEMMFTNWASDPAVTRYLRWSPHRTWVETAELLHEWSQHYGEPDFYAWAITDRQTGEVFGSIALIHPEPDAHLPRPADTIWEPGYAIGRAWWNKGYTTEALCAVRDFFFEEVGGDLLTCCHAVENPASGAVMRKAGFVYDHDTQYHKFDGTPVNCRAYLLKREHEND